MHLPSFIQEPINRLAKQPFLSLLPRSKRPVRQKEYPPSLATAFYLEQSVSIFSNMVQVLKQETFRRGFTWKPKFACKCAICGTVYQEKQTQCGCGSFLFTEPDKRQIKAVMRANGISFLQEANKNGNSLKAELQEFQRFLDVADRSYVFCEKSYVYDDAGNIITAIPIEFLTIDPRMIEPITQDNGLPGGKIWTCIAHRDVVEQQDIPCKICGRKLHDVLYETTATGRDKQYYIKDEIYTRTFHYRDGFPPILRLVYEAYSYMYMVRQTHNTYKDGRGKGIFTFPTNNAESLKTMWDEFNRVWEEDPDYVPVIGFDPGSGKGVAQFIKFLEDPNPAMLEVKKELRERMGAMFGVSLIFQNDTSASGGLNNEGLEIIVTNRAVESRQGVYNGDVETDYRDGLLSWFCEQFGITDFVLQVNPSEEQDEMAEKQRFNQDAQNAKIMADIGFDVTFKNGKFEYSEVAKKPMPPMFGGPSELPAPSQPQQPDNRMSGTPVNVHKEEPDELAEYHGDQLIKSFADEAIAAVRQGALYPFYSDVSLEIIPKIHDIIKQAFLAHNLSLRDMIAKMEALGLEHEKARMIARTESTAVAMKSREIGYRKMEKERGEVFKYKAVITNDYRTSSISKRIKAAVDAEGGAVTLDRLKEIYKEESTKPYIKGDPENSGMGSTWTGWENYVGHPYERDSIVRVV